MLKIAVNTNYESPGSKICVDDLVPRLKRAGHKVVRNDWNNYQDYNLALFMSPDAQVQHAKQINPNIQTCIMIPMTESKALQQNAKDADFLMVGSLEARDEQIKYNPNIFIYYHFPSMVAHHKRHAPKSTTVIGYHGNREHLVAFHPYISKALSKLAINHEIELHAIYNYQKHGKWTRHTPSGLKIKHIQWKPTVYRESLAHCDIGIVNNNVPMPKGLYHHITSPLVRYLRWQVPAYYSSDTVLRFKYPTNPGRVYPFAQLGIPVVADFAPSMNQIIKDGHSGEIVNSAAGWFYALKRLVESPDLRQTYSDNLRHYIDSEISIDQNFNKLNKFLLSRCASK